MISFSRIPQRLLHQQRRLPPPPPLPPWRRRPFSSTAAVRTVSSGGDGGSSVDPTSNHTARPTLRELVARARSANNANNATNANHAEIDWDRIAAEHFPGKSALELLYQYEYGTSQEEEDLHRRLRGGGDGGDPGGDGGDDDEHKENRGPRVRFTKEQDERLLEFMRAHDHNQRRQEVSRSTSSTSSSSTTPAPTDDVDDTAALAFTIEEDPPRTTTRRWTFTVEELRRAVGGHFTRAQYLTRYYRITSSRSWSERELAELLRSHNRGEPIEEFARRHRRLTEDCRHHQWKAVVLSGSASAAAAASRQRERGATPFAVTFLRRQYQVMGPQWRALDQLIPRGSGGAIGGGSGTNGATTRGGGSVSGTLNLRACIQRTNHYWFDVPVFSLEDPALLGPMLRSNMPWSTTELSRLEGLVQAYLDQDDYRDHHDHNGDDKGGDDDDGQRFDHRERSPAPTRAPTLPTTITSRRRTTVDWNAIGRTLGRSPSMCERKYGNVARNILRWGRFSAEEDQKLLEHWKRHRFHRLAEALPNRDRMSSMGRLRRLLGKHVQSHGSYTPCLEAGVRLQDAADSLSRSGGSVGEVPPSG